MVLELPPVEVGRAAAHWDEQHLDLHGAGVTVSRAGVAGFSRRVRGTARTFRDDWAVIVEALARDAEARADGIRSAVSAVLATDEGVDEALRAGVHRSLLGASVETR